MVVSEICLTELSTCILFEEFLRVPVTEESRYSKLIIRLAKETSFSNEELKEIHNMWYRSEPIKLTTLQENGNVLWTGVPDNIFKIFWIKNIVSKFMDPRYFDLRSQYILDSITLKSSSILTVNISVNNACCIIKDTEMVVNEVNEECVYRPFANGFPFWSCVYSDVYLQTDVSSPDLQITAKYLVCTEEVPELTQTDQYLHIPTVGDNYLLLKNGEVV